MMIRQRAASRDRLSLLFPMMTFLCAATASAQSPMLARRDYPSLGSDPLVADFNGDGKLDLAGLGVKAAVLMLGNGASRSRPLKASMKAFSMGLPGRMKSSCTPRANGQSSSARDMNSVPSSS
jgi:hypothetical protein